MNDVLIKDVEELNAAVENVSYALYGAGRVARNVIKYLAKNGMRRPNKIYVSDESENPQEIMGIPVIMLSKCDFDVSGSVLLCCAKENLHEEFKKEIEHYTFKKIYFVSDNLYEQLMYINGDFEIENYYELIKIQKQNEEIKRRQCKGFAKVGIEYFIINILDHCNLKCRGCDHFACIADEYFVPYESIHKDVERVADLFSGDYINNLSIMGGEPLLHPELLLILKDVRQHFPHAIIRLTTNGVLLLQQTDEFWKVCRENDVTIIVTKYPINLNFVAMKEKAEKEKVRYRYFEETGEHITKKLFKKEIDLLGDSNPTENWLTCGLTPEVAFLMEGRLYPCPFMCQSYRIFNKKFNQNMRLCNDDFLDIYNAKDKQEVLKFLSTPKYYCRYCEKGNTHLDYWSRSKGDISEWIEV